MEWISLALSCFAVVSGLISHYFVVIKKITVLETKQSYNEKDIVTLKEHLPKIEGKLEASNQLLTELNSQFKFLLNNSEKK